MRRFDLASLLLVVALGACDPTGSQESPELAATTDAWAEAYNAGDIAAVMALFTEDSSITFYPETHLISGFFAIERVQAEELDFGGKITIAIVETEGNSVTWNQLTEGEDDGEEIKSCVYGHTAIIEDGKIINWRWPAAPDFECNSPLDIG